MPRSARRPGLSPADARLMARLAPAKEISPLRGATKEAGSFGAALAAARRRRMSAGEVKWVDEQLAKQADYYAALRAQGLGDLVPDGR